MNLLHICLHFFGFLTGQRRKPVGHGDILFLLIVGVLSSTDSRLRADGVEALKNTLKMEELEVGSGPLARHRGQHAAGGWRLGPCSSGRRNMRSRTKAMIRVTILTSDPKLFSWPTKLLVKHGICRSHELQGGQPICEDGRPLALLNLSASTTGR